MPSSVLDILTASALSIGAVQSGEPLDPGEAADILATWQRLISSSNIQADTVLGVRQDSYVLTPGTQSYTLGTDPVSGSVGTLSAIRPNRITGVNIQLPGSTMQQPLANLDADDWRKLTYLNWQGIPTAFYCDGSNPLSTLSFNMIPNLAYPITVYAWDKLPQQLNLADTVVFADGYERFWVAKLAIEIAPMFAMTPSPTLVAICQEAEDAVRSANRRSPRIKTNHGLKYRHGVWIDARYFVPGMVD